MVPLSFLIYHILHIFIMNLHSCNQASISLVLVILSSGLFQQVKSSCFLILPQDFTTYPIRTWVYIILFNRTEEKEIVPQLFSGAYSKG